MRPLGRHRVAALLAAGLALNLALLWLYWHPEPKALIGDEHYYAALGTAWAAGGSVPDDPLWPPLYGAALGMVFGGASRLAVQLVQILVWLATGLGLWVVARRVTTPRAADVCLLVYVASPELIAFSHGLWPETLHLGLLVGALVAWTWPRRAGGPEAAGGALLGVASGFKSLLVPWVPAALAARAWRGPGSWRRRVGVALVGLAAAAAGAVPGLWLQHRLHGEFDLAPSAEFNVWLGLQDTGCADFRSDVAGLEHYAFARSGDTLARRNQVYRGKIAERIAARGLGSVALGQLGKQYTRLLGYQGFFTTQLPRGPREAYRFADAPWVRALRWLCYGFHFALLGLAAVGLGLVDLRANRGARLLVGLLVYQLAVFACVHVTTRYLVQMLPVLMVFAGSGAEAAWSGWRGRPLPAGCAGGRGRWAVAAGLVLLAWWAALGDALRCRGPWGLG